MKVLHIAETDRGASGVATFVREIDSALRAYGVESVVAMDLECMGDSSKAAASALGALAGKALDKKHAVRPDVVHVHGLWLPLFHGAVKRARAAGIPVVWSTHGMTAPWSMRHKWWKKMLAWLLYQKRDLKSAAAIHCTTEQEVEWNKALGFTNCFIAPLGTREFSDRVEQVEHAEKRLLFVGRIYPVKGLVNLIRAWHVLHESTCSTWLKDWKLRIVGPDEAGHQAELEKLVDDLDLRGSVEFSGPKFGEELSREYEECDCLVLSSFTENFGATVVDAMAHGKPVVTSTFTPWKEVRDRGCGWWVSNKPEELAKAIQEMIDVGEARRKEMGMIGRRLVEERYTWNAVAEAMQREYGRVADLG